MVGVVVDVVVEVVVDVEDGRAPEASRLVGSEPSHAAVVTTTASTTVRHPRSATRCSCYVARFAGPTGRAGLRFRVTVEEVDDARCRAPRVSGMARHR